MQSIKMTNILNQQAKNLKTLNSSLYDAEAVSDDFVTVGQLLIDTHNSDTLGQFMVHNHIHLASDLKIKLNQFSDYTQTLRDLNNFDPQCYIEYKHGKISYLNPKIVLKLIQNIQNSIVVKE